MNKLKLFHVVDKRVWWFRKVEFWVPALALACYETLEKVMRLAKL